MENEQKPSFEVGTILKYWPIVLVMGSIIGQWAVFGQRIQSIEERQDRQSTAIMTLQTGLAEVQQQYAALGAKIDAMDNNIDYIRSRIDRAIQ